MAEQGARQASPHRRGGWKKSSYSSGSCTCVEIRAVGDRVEIHDSKDPRCELSPGDEPIISVSVPAWSAFLLALALAPLAASTEALIAIPGENDDVALRCTATGTTLLFNQAEWDAFLAGAAAGEFALEPSRSY